MFFTHLTKGELWQKLKREADSTIEEFIPMQVPKIKSEIISKQNTFNHIRRILPEKEIIEINDSEYREDY